MTEDTNAIRLVQEIEKHHCLYNYTKKSYCDERAKSKAWEAISSAVNISGND